MIVVAIVAILASIALPSYSEYVKRGNRASARAALMEAAQFLERFYAANDAYDVNKAGVTVALPSTLQAVPTDSPKYDLTVTATSNGYTLTATPRASDMCGNLTLTNTGAKGTSSSLTVQECWR
jgi:type IV pilus assembly protein PilE